MEEEKKNEEAAQKQMAAMEERRDMLNIHLQMRVDTYLKIFRSSLALMRQMRPEQFAEELAKRKAEVTANMTNGGYPNAVVEMIAMCQVDYEAELMESKVSPFSTALLNFAKANNIIQ